VNNDVLLVIVGGLVGIVSSLLTTLIREILERKRLAVAKENENREKLRELRLAILKEKFEPAFELMGAALKVIETSKNAEEAYQQFEILWQQQSYWSVWARQTNEWAEEYLSMAIRYARIKEGEEQWRSYGAGLMHAARELSRLYDRESERLFSEVVATH
jgi:hypothetical protein